MFNFQQTQAMKEDKHKYNAGDVVYAKVNPEVKLIIRRYVTRIYYCQFADDPERKEVVLFEREIVE